jgi:hypothetical protein
MEGTREEGPLLVEALHVAARRGDVEELMRITHDLASPQLKLVNLRDD